jgi:hypothetical protein
MKPLLIITFLTLLFSCSTEKEKQKTPLSQWLIENEDSMYTFLKTHQIPIDTDWTNTTAYSSEHVILIAGFKTLQDKLKNIDSLINVHICYDRHESKVQYSLLLSRDFIKSNSNCLDTILNDIDSLRHFKIVKYREPSGLFSTQINDNDTINADQIKFTIKPANSKFDICLITTKPIEQSTKDIIIQSVFGEKVYQNQINNIEHKVSTDKNLNAKTIEETRSFFKIKND